MYICKILSLRFVIFHYDLPAVLGSSVLYYDLSVTKLRPGPRVTTTYTSAQSPDLIENLEPRSEYEVMVQAVSRQGRGEPSSRLVFMTSNHREEIERSANTGERDVTRCCEAVSVSHECQPLSCKNKRSSRKAAALELVHSRGVQVVAPSPTLSPPSMWCPATPWAPPSRPQLSASTSPQRPGQDLGDLYPEFQL